LINLSARFPLVVDESSKPFGWGWAKDANFEFAPRLSVAQGIALLLAQAHLRPLLPRHMLQELMPLFDVAERELASGAWRDWHQRTAVLPSMLTLLPPALDARVLDDVHEALALRRQLSAIYRSKGAKEGRPVTIHPLGLIQRGPVHYLACTLFDYTDVRQLAVHRISDTTVTKEQSYTPAGFDFATYAKTAGRYETEGPIHLVVRFTAEAAEHLRETPLSPDQVITELDASPCVEVSATVLLDQTLRWWLKGFGSQAEVLEPKTLRAELLADLEASLRAYRGETKAVKQ
jgi:predicted DNA-binding transcriptional regulator YafY